MYDRHCISTIRRGNTKAVANVQMKEPEALRVPGQEENDDPNVTILHTDKHRSNVILASKARIVFFKEPRRPLKDAHVLMLSNIIQPTPVYQYSKFVS